MTIFIAIILGIIQGLTEFLPVSSSGHLLLFEKLFGIEGDNLAFNIVAHMGTLLAVIICYRKKLVSMIKKPFSKPVYLLVVASVPTVIIYFAFKSFFERAFVGEFIGICFFVTAIFLIISTVALKNNGKEELSYKTAFIMGTFQGFAILPGISRSGTTLTAGLIAGADKESVADFSFLMSLPIIVGSLVLEIFSGGFVSVDIFPLIAGFISSFICGYLAIKFMLNVVKNKSFIPFVIYLVGVGIYSFFV